MRDTNPTILKPGDALFVLEENGDDVVKYNNKWFRSPDEFLEKGRLPDGVRITTAIYDITELNKTILTD